MESIAVTSWLSIYSTSGLLKESQVDIVSSIETDTPSDLLGENSMLHGGGGILKILGEGNTTSFPLGKDATNLGSKIELGLTLVEGKTCPEKPTLLAGCVFLDLGILFEHGTFKFEIENQKSKAGAPNFTKIKYTNIH